MSMKNKDGLRLASCPGRNPRTFVQRGHPGEEGQVTPHLVGMQAACRGFVSRKKEVAPGGGAWT